MGHAMPSQVLCNQESLRLGQVPDLEPDHQYYIEMEVSLEILSSTEVRGFENWLMGIDNNAAEEMGVSGVEAESSGSNSSLSNLALGVVKKMAGISDPTAKAQSPLFTIKINDTGF